MSSGFDDKRATAIINKAVEKHMYAQDAMPATEAARIMAAEELVQCARQVEQIKDAFAAQGLTGDELIARVPTWPAIEEVLFTANVLVGSSNGDQTLELPSAPPIESTEEKSDVTAPQDSSASIDTTSVDRPQQEVSVEAPDRPIGTAVMREDPKAEEPWLDAQGEEWLVLAYSGGQEARVRKVSTGEETVVPAGFLKTKKQEDQVEDVPSLEQQREEAEKTRQTIIEILSSSSIPSAQEPDPRQALEENTPDDEGDDRYADLLDETSRRYAPSGMVVPHDLAYQPAPMPDGEHEINDAEAKRLHLQFNALAARAKFLHDVEDARARGCDLVRRLYLRGAKRLAREELGTKATETAVNEMAEDDENVKTWAERKQRHAEEASAWKTHFEINTQNVVVLSRDWTMRDRQVQS